MFYQSLITENVVYELSLEKNGSVALLSEATLETLIIFLRKDDQPSFIIINDQIGGKWGDELRMTVPREGEPGDSTVWFKFDGGKIEIGTFIESETFIRFDAQRADEVQLVRMLHASNPNMTLATGIPRLSSSLAKIEHHILSRRINALEEKLMGGAKNGE